MTLKYTLELFRPNDVAYCTLLVSPGHLECIVLFSLFYVLLSFGPGEGDVSRDHIKGSHQQVSCCTSKISIVRVDVIYCKTSPLPSPSSSD